ncbi:hypothetical protein FPJ27_24220 [Burkholderia sp. MS455]|nr:hypothetical protein FPJ27_24220 [Burkholderia sp. MS455]
MTGRRPGPISNRSLSGRPVDSDICGPSIRFPVASARRLAGPILGRTANDAHGSRRRAKMRRQRFQRRNARRAAHRPPLFPQESFPCPSRCTRLRCPS